MNSDAEREAIETEHDRFFRFRGPANPSERCHLSSPADFHPGSHDDS